MKAEELVGRYFKHDLGDLIYVKSFENETMLKSVVLFHDEIGGNVQELHYLEKDINDGFLEITKQEFDKKYKETVDKIYKV